MFIPKLNSKWVFKYPFDSGKKFNCQNVLKETTLHFFFFFATADSISISVLLTKGSRFIIKK